MRRPSLETDRQRRFSASSNSAASTRGSRRSSTTDDGVATRRRPSLDNKSLKLSTCARVAPPESTTPAPKAARFGDDVATAAPSAATLAGMPGGSASFRRRSTLQGRAGAAEGPSDGSRRLSMSAALSSLLLPVNEGTDEAWNTAMVPGLEEDDEAEHPLRMTDTSHLTAMIAKSQLKWKLLPFGRLRTAWDLFTLPLVLYTGISLPIVLAFLPSTFSNPGMDAIELVMDFVFLIDIVLNFNTCVVTPDAKLVVERKEIVSRYLRGWFVLDCLGSVPLEIVTLIGGEALLEGGAGQASTLQV